MKVTNRTDEDQPTKPDRTPPGVRPRSQAFRHHIMGNLCWCSPTTAGYEVGPILNGRHLGPAVRL